MNPIVTFSHVTYAYPQMDRPAIKDISFTIDSGEFVALIGPTGAGKSSLCYCFNGAVPRLFNGDMQGRVEVAGLDTFQNEIPVLAQHVGLVVQNARTQLFNVTVLQEVAFGCENLGLPCETIRTRVKEALDFVGLAGIEKREPSALSGGQQQRVAIACVLAMNPEVLVLDEPTSELDPIGSEQVMEVIARLNRDLNKTIFMVTHDMEFVAKYATRVLVLNQGSMIEDNSPETVFSQADLLQEARIRPPQVCEVMLGMRQRGYRIDQIPITLENTVELLKEMRNGCR
ncbi:MAG: ATP-binding cassette domain-containing protein [Anaerolineaceae bacterium]|nr:ATP-binding cassette domain-containing protein [Anaerolineaceae bacterium]